MKKLVLIGAALLLSACVSHNFKEGERAAWRCESGQEFSLRRVAGYVEVFAAGQTYALQPSGEDAFSNGQVTYSVARGRASLAGAAGGPFENCRRTGVLPRVW
ncbi:MAG: hypothetical protein NVV62_08605 [Terricaulis sp.]|nr:hypothetical protein [Terricaulis sp.]